ncbi:hypothetical protein CCC_01237 [Paramagnetospirillum magnetotacticum MS-1]|uniref:Uncharacterized protein n=1 Tax=Paramagnetospirillum magnetotacticum MS-1 TaxID=272627 RepID=A0A0C2UZD5_PARME|nr:hypothetical protein [Paramagnetospirillum magnetotacticum]KIL98176.1 hypothetical protein CCC_01237 [Paramagnetospirillum magnetotacticum MS-1]
MQHTVMGGNGTFDEDIVDELEGEALVILEHPEQHAAITVNMARKTLEIIRRIRERPVSDAIGQMA